MEQFTYQEYLKRPNTITFEEAEKIHNQIVENTDKSDIEFQEHWGELLERIIKYAATRASWYTQLNQQERIDQDSSRTSTHDSVITHFDVIARYMKNQGKDASWRNKLGNERKRIGDFACYLAYIYGINSR